MISDSHLPGGRPEQLSSREIIGEQPIGAPEHIRGGYELSAVYDMHSVSTMQRQGRPMTMQSEKQYDPETRKEAAEKMKKKLKRSEKSVKEYQYFILRLFVFLLVLWILFFQIVGLTHMPSGDMAPRLDAGDLVLFYRLDKNVKAQDVIVIEKVTPDSDGEKALFISRVIAAAGDTVEITEDGHVIVNGNSLIESNIFSTTQPYKGYTEYPLTLGKGECFVLSDARRNCEDSRYFGPVARKEIQGSVITIVRRNNL